MQVAVGEVAQPGGGRRAVARPAATASRSGTRGGRCAVARPGSMPASVRTWKPLHEPITGPPAAAKASTARMIGEKRAMAPVRRWSPCAKPPGSTTASAAPRSVSVCHTRRASQPSTAVGDMREVALGPGPGKDRHRDARAAGSDGHGFACSASCCSSARSSQLAVSMTGLASRRRHISSTAASAAPWSVASKADAHQLAAAHLAHRSDSPASAARSRSSGPPDRRSRSGARRGPRPASASASSRAPRPVR